MSGTYITKNKINNNEINNKINNNKTHDDGVLYLTCKIVNDIVGYILI